MTLAPITINGTLKDFGGNLPVSSEIIFFPSSEAMSPEYLLSAKPISVIPSSITGVFSVDLFPTDTTQPATWYTIRIRSLDVTLPPVHMDFPDWKIYVPSGASPIFFSSILALPSNPAMTWVSLASPPNPSPGTWWLETNPENFDDPANTGNLYEWTN